MRKENKARMTVPEQLQKIKDDICKNYCRYSYMLNESLKEAPFPEQYREKCKDCPMNELQVFG